MTGDEFVQLLADALGDRETFLTAGLPVEVSRIDARTLGVEVGRRRFIVSVEAVDADEGRQELIRND